MSVAVLKYCIVNIKKELENIFYHLFPCKNIGKRCYHLFQLEKTVGNFVIICFNGKTLRNIVTVHSNVKTIWNMLPIIPMGENIVKHGYHLFQWGKHCKTFSPFISLEKTLGNIITIYFVIKNIGKYSVYSIRKKHWVMLLPFIPVGINIG